LAVAEAPSLDEALQHRVRRVKVLPVLFIFVLWVLLRGLLLLCGGHGSNGGGRRRDLGVVRAVATALARCGRGGSLIGHGRDAVSGVVGLRRCDLPVEVCHFISHGLHLWLWLHLFRRCGRRWDFTGGGAAPGMRRCSVRKRASIEGIVDEIRHLQGGLRRHCSWCGLRGRRRELHGSRWLDDGREYKLRARGEDVQHRAPRAALARLAF
jgi:hypothetical protein